MTTDVVNLAALLGDDIDHSHHVLRDGERLAKLPGARMWCDGMPRPFKLNAATLNLPGRNSRLR